MSAEAVAAKRDRGAGAATARVAFSPARAWLIARVTLRAAVRERLLVAIALVACAFVVGAHWLGDLNFGSSEERFVEDFGLGAMMLFGGGLTIVATVDLFWAEIEQRTAAALLAKPVWRAEFVLGKFLAAALVAAAFCALMIAALTAVVWLRGPAIGWSGLLAAGLAAWLKLTVLAALALLLASFARSRLFAVSMGFLVWAICEFQYVAQEAAAHGGSAVSRATAAAVAIAFPDFRGFDLVTGASGVVAWGGLGRVARYSAVYVVAVGALAALSFRKREI
jgi:hypothetical protein